MLLAAIIKVTADGVGQSLCKIADGADVDRYVILLRRACKRKRMILPDRDLRTTQENVL